MTRKSLLTFIDFLFKGFVKNINFMKSKHIRYQLIKPSKPKFIEILLDIKKFYIFCNPSQLHIEICFYFSKKRSAPSSRDFYKKTWKNLFPVPVLGYVKIIIGHILLENFRPKYKNCGCKTHQHRIDWWKKTRKSLIISLIS